MKIRFGKKEDATSIIALDKKVFPREWIVDNDFLPKVLQKNPYTYRVIEDNGNIVGFYCFFPLNKDKFEEILQGKITEKNVIEHIIDFNNPKDVYLYGATINIDLSHENRKKIRHLLVKDINLYLDFLSNKKIQVKEFGAIAITKLGIYFCNSINMKKTSNLDGNFIFRSNLDDLNLE